MKFAAIAFVLVLTACGQNPSIISAKSVSPSQSSTVSSSNEHKKVESSSIETRKDYCGKIYSAGPIDGIMASDGGQVKLAQTPTDLVLITDNAEVYALLNEIRHKNISRTGCVSSSVFPTQGFEGLYLKIDSIQFDLQ